MFLFYHWFFQCQIYLLCPFSLLFFLFSFLLPFQFSKNFFFLNKSSHALHVTTNDTLSVFLINFLFALFGLCKAYAMGEMCLQLSLFSDPVCMVVLLPEFSSRALGIISATSRSNVWKLIYLCSWLTFLDSALLQCSHLEVLALPSNAFISLLRVGSASYFLL